MNTASKDNITSTSCTASPSSNTYSPGVKRLDLETNNKKYDSRVSSKTNTLHVETSVLPVLQRPVQNSIFRQTIQFTQNHGTNDLRGNLDTGTGETDYHARMRVMYSSPNV